MSEMNHDKKAREAILPRVEPGEEMSSFMAGEDTSMTAALKKEALLNFLYGEIEQCEEYVGELLNYITMCTNREDWHGVEDAASDIRDLKAEQKAYTKVLTYLKEHQ